MASRHTSAHDPYNLITRAYHELTFTLEERHLGISEQIADEARPFHPEGAEAVTHTCAPQRERQSETAEVEACHRGLAWDDECRIHRPAAYVKAHPRQLNPPVEGHYGSFGCRRPACVNVCR